MSCVRIAVGERTASVSALTPTVFRISFAESGVSFAVNPGGDDARILDKLSLLEHLPNCPLKCAEKKMGTRTLETESVRIVVNEENFALSWDAKVDDNTWTRVAQDRPIDPLIWTFDGKVRHYQVLEEDDAFFGLGECSGNLDRLGRRIRLAPTDAMGYDAESSQPLYKNIPFFIKKKRGGGEAPAVGIFYDTPSDCIFDFGCERSNYFGRYRYAEVREFSFVLNGFRLGSPFCVHFSCLMKKTIHLGACKIV